jgi:hypothetical protein
MLRVFGEGHRLQFKPIHAGLLASLHHDLGLHLRVNRTVVVVGTPACERKRETIILSRAFDLNILLSSLVTT